MKLAWVLVAGCATDDGGPRLESVTPASAARNATVSLTGTRLCGASADCTHVGASIELGLDLPAVDAAITAYSATAATIVVPAAAPIGKTSLIVTVGDQSSNALTFEVTP